MDPNRVFEGVTPLNPKFVFPAPLKIFERPLPLVLNAISESTDNLEISLFCLYLLNYVIKYILGSQNGPLMVGHPCQPNSFCHLLVNTLNAHYTCIASMVTGLDCLGIYNKLSQEPLDQKLACLYSF